MFHNIPTAVQAQMKRLETIDTTDRIDGTPRLFRLRQVPPVTGRFLAIAAASAPSGSMLELGTSAGYSALWLALACRATGRHLTSVECDEHKYLQAKETVHLAKVEDVVTLIHGDAVDVATRCEPPSFCFLDIEKELYSACYESLVRQLIPGGLLVADNVISHEEALAPFVAQAMADSRLDAVVVPIGKGELLCRRN